MGRYLLLPEYEPRRLPLLTKRYGLHDTIELILVNSTMCFFKTCTVISQSFMLSLVALFVCQSVAEYIPDSPTSCASTTDAAATSSPGSGDDPSPLYSWVGLFVSVAGAMCVTRVGLDASVTVAIQCMGGRSWGKYCIFNGTLDLKSRKEGMNIAFGADREIYPPRWLAGIMEHAPLSGPDYDN